MLARQPQARLWNRTNSNFPKTQGPVARKKSQKATQILRAGNVLPTPRGNPRNRGPGPTPPVRGRCRVATEGVGWQSIGCVPSGVLPSFSPWKKKVAARRRRNPPRTTDAVRTLPPHSSRLRRATFPYPLCRFATSSLPLLAYGHFPLIGGIGPLTRGVGPRGEGFWGDLAP